MKITAIRATPVNIPPEAPYLWSYSALPGFSKTIIEVETDAGITGIGTAAYLHLCVAMPWSRDPNQSLLRMQPLDVVEEGPFQPRDKVIAVPESPGLGATLSPEHLAHCHQLFLDDGPMIRHQNPMSAEVFVRLPLA